VIVPEPLECDGGGLPPELGVLGLPPPLLGALEPVPDEVAGVVEAGAELVDAACDCVVCGAVLFGWCFAGTLSPARPPPNWLANPAPEGALRPDDRVVPIPEPLAEFLPLLEIASAAPKATIPATRAIPTTRNMVEG
jgi:hypothetical protein